MSTGEEGIIRHFAGRKRGKFDVRTGELIEFDFAKNQAVQWPFKYVNTKISARKGIGVAAFAECGAFEAGEGLEFGFVQVEVGDNRFQAGAGGGIVFLSEFEGCDVSGLIIHPAEAETRAGDVPVGDAGVGAVRRQIGRKLGEEIAAFAFDAGVFHHNPFKNAIFSIV